MHSANTERFVQIVQKNEEGPGRQLVIDKLRPCAIIAANFASRTVLRDETCRGVHQQSIAIILVRSEEFLRTELVDRHGRSIHSLAGAGEPAWESLPSLPFRP